MNKFTVYDLNQAKKRIFFYAQHGYLSILFSFLEGTVLFTKTGFLMPDAVRCSVQIDLIVPCQVTLTRADVLCAQQSNTSADKSCQLKM